ncbi:hypothetical protein JOE68_003671 [Saccharothrix algeriensis]|uniref:TNT domain-containing protein n=1 Tax=Saccharothrix algeriensis TaxID=173560 RepID=A0ABS2S978_9PSEU|nr:hypothetical protein [Saccharothrix algeriensis]
MSEPKPLNPTEQDALVKQIGLTLMRAAPDDWRHVAAEYRATGRYFELAAEVRSADGTMRAWSPPQEVAGLFSRLRAGMYREGRGSWSNARYQLDHPSSYNLDFDRAEPAWQTPPPPQAYVDEMRFFPRAEENVPDWLRRRLAQQPAPPAPQRGFRTARVFDGAGPGGRPSVNRPPVPEDERELLLDYLHRAPVAVIGRGFDADVLNPESPAVVPVAFQTDGTWIWPAAVGYYLREYGVPPEPELVDWVRAGDFALPEVGEDARIAAAANLGAPAAPRDTALPVAEPFGTFAGPEVPAEVGATVAAPLPELLDADEPEHPAEPEDARVAGHEPELARDAAHLRDGEHAPDAEHAGAAAHGGETVHLREPLHVRDPEHGPEPAGSADVEETANLTELKPDVVEYAQSGPPYRVRFEEDGPVIDDRYRRDTYVDGMDLFAPAQYDRDQPAEYEPEPGDTRPWSPFAEQDGPAGAEAGRAGADGGAPEEAAAEDPDRADVPVADAGHEPPHERAEGPSGADERTAGFEADEDERYHDQPAFEQQRYAEEPDRFAEQQFAEQPEQSDRFAEQRFAEQPEQPERFTEQQQFTEQQRFAEQPGRFGEQPDRFADRAEFAEQPPRFGEQQQFADRSEQPDRFADRDDYADEPFEEPAAEPRQVTPEEERELSGVRRALDDLDVPPAAYRFGEPADRTWVLRTEGRSWEVSWFDRGPTNPVHFDRVEDAAAYLIGKLVLTGRRAPRPLPPPPPRTQPPRPPVAEGFREEHPRPPAGDAFREEPSRPPVAEGFREEPPRPPVAEGFRDEPQRPPAGEGFRDEQHRAHGEGFREDPPRPPANNGFRDDRRPVPPPRPDAQPEQPKARPWPITPMNGEPPLTLFRHKQMVELPAGVEVDRFGDGSGNLVYAAGTPFAERSLVPSWVNRPYRVYRLRRQVEVLTGVAVPWFEQPGGGTAYLLPKSVEDMLADGVLVEVANQEAPSH